MNRILTFIIAITLSLGMNAKELIVKSNKKPNHPAAFDQAKMMDCDAPVTYTEFSLNNIRFGLETAGQIWENNGDASYEVPKVDPTSNEIPVHSLYAGALWVGGYSPDGQLRLAAVTYRTGGGTDFYNGPLSNNNFASADLCDDFDVHFPEFNLIPTTTDANGNVTAFRVAGARRLDAQRHRAYHDALATGTVEQVFPEGYATPEYFNDWPGNNFNPNYDFYLAPFFDYNGDEIYNPDDGDYPWFDLDNTNTNNFQDEQGDCTARAVTDPIPLFGDEAMWWVFNDNGGVHTETGGQPIGMEVQAQAFAFTTTDEVNNMTFYNYVLINRGTKTLERCYFGQWVDPDVGCPTDDYVGCDVQRGLGYTYNGDENDESCTGVPGYGLTPPAVGIDFFEGPYQDADGINNPLSLDLEVVNSGLGIPYGGIGIGYANDELDPSNPLFDQVIDNERFGMRRFVYYNRNDQTTTPNINGEPDIAIEFYNYLDGIWKNGEPMTYGGNGVGGTIATDYMFPGLTDPVGFATNGAITNDDWREETENNQPGDRRFIQSAGKFILEPGEFNNITVGAVWARPFGNTDQTLNALRIADDKAQSLFDNCFRILTGPDAPDVEVVELDEEIVLIISNENPTSNNYREEYGFGQPQGFAFDPLIPGIDCEGVDIPFEEKFYEFQGYKVYQLKNSLVSSAELNNPDLARLQFQCDIQDGVTQLVNWVDDPQLGIKTPVEMVNGADQGIQHSFRITEDLFATEATNLVNHRQYYFMVVAYAYNEWSPYDGAIDGACGQALPYLESRKSATGGIPVVDALPHKPVFANGGTVVNSEYGQGLPVTRIEGEGNGGNILNLSEKSIEDILNSPTNMVNEITYEVGGGPVEVKVINPLRVPDTKLTLYTYVPESEDFNDVVDEWEIDEPQSVRWYMIDERYPTDTIWGIQDLSIGGEEIIKDPVTGVPYGLSVSLRQYEYNTISQLWPRPDVLDASIEFENLEFVNWIRGVEDTDEPTEMNWIRAGTSNDADNFDMCEEGNPFEDECYYFDFGERDNAQIFEGILGGTVSPWHLVSRGWSGAAPADEYYQAANDTRLTDLNSVDVVMTPNKDHWTRVPVLEMQSASSQAFGLVDKMYTRLGLSLDKNGKNQLNGGNVNECTYNGEQVLTADDVDDMSNGEIERHKIAAWPNQDPDDISDNELIGLSFGMSWFPGYAIDLETGERLCMAFGEDSWLVAENGRDMMWNPTSTVSNDLNPNMFFNPNNARLGGMHYVYVFRNFRRQGTADDRMPHYDGANYMYDNINESATERKRIFRSCTWVFFPLLQEGFEQPSMEDGAVPTKTTIKIRVAKPYERMATIAGLEQDYPYNSPYSNQFDYFFWDEESGVADADDFEPGDFPGQEPAINRSQNQWMPMYEISTEGFAAETQTTDALSEAWEENPINVVPNPYYGFSDYELSRLQNKVKVINLPYRCNIKIYNTSGTLVKNVIKDDNLTEYEWNLTNEQNVPIAGGVYIFHIEVPGVGEHVVKWFGALRPIDLDNF